jgi:hypothetical protein
VTESYLSLHGSFVRTGPYHQREELPDVRRRQDSPLGSRATSPDGKTPHIHLGLGQVRVMTASRSTGVSRPRRASSHVDGRPPRARPRAQSAVPGALPLRLWSAHKPSRTRRAARALLLPAGSMRQGLSATADRSSLRHLVPEPPARFGCGGVLFPPGMSAPLPQWVQHTPLRGTTPRSRRRRGSLWWNALTPVTASSIGCSGQSGWRRRRANGSCSCREFTLRASGASEIRPPVAPARWRKPNSAILPVAAR